MANFVLAERAPASLKTMGLVEPPGCPRWKKKERLSRGWHLLMVCQCSWRLQPNGTNKSRVYAAWDVPRNKSARCGSVGLRPWWVLPPSYKKVDCQRRTRKIRICLTRAKEMRSLVNTCSCRHQQKLASIFPVGFTRKEIRKFAFLWNLWYNIYRKWERNSNKPLLAVRIRQTN